MEKLIKIKKILLIVIIILVISTIVIMFVNSKLSPYFIGVTLVLAFIYEFIINLIEEHSKNK